jgi:hypothetical protein
VQVARSSAAGGIESAGVTLHVTLGKLHAACYRKHAGLDGWQMPPARQAQRSSLADGITRLNQPGRALTAKCGAERMHVGPLDMFAIHQGHPADSPCRKCCRSGRSTRYHAVHASLAPNSVGTTAATACSSCLLDPETLHRLTKTCITEHARRRKRVWVGTGGTMPAVKRSHNCKHRLPAIKGTLSYAYSKYSSPP